MSRIDTPSNNLKLDGYNQALIDCNSAGNALEVRQIGSGNALVVEDSPSPDSTPFVIDVDGRIGNGLQPAANGWRYQQLTTNTTLNSGGAKLTNIVGNLNSSWLSFEKARGAIGAPTGVSTGDYLGGISFQGYYGGTTNDYQTSAYIFAAADGTQADGSSPGRLVFSTTANGASFPTERFRISNFGGWGLAGANYGTSGTQAIVSNGNAAAPTWQNVVIPGGALGTPSSGILSNCTVDGTNEVGYKNIPQNSQSAAYTLVLGDAGKHLLHPSADTSARTFTIPANSSVAFQIGTEITFVNQASAGTLTIAITTDTMRLAGAGTTGSRTLAANGIATALKITSTEWIISGTGLT